MKSYSIIKSYKQIIILFWIILTIILWLQLLGRGPFMESTITVACYLAPVVLVNIFLSNYLLPKAIRERKMNVFIAQFIFLTVLVGLILTLILYGLRHFEQVGYFAPSELFPINYSFPAEFRDQILGVVVINLGFCGIRFYYEHAKLEKINHESQFRNLQQQITPHFMFNVLNHIDILMQEDVRLASSLLMKYSDILRYQLYNGNKAYIPLVQEIRFLKNYIDVEKIRWDDKLDVNCSWKIEDENKEIPSLLLIVFIENAFKHVSRTTTEKGYIDINFEQHSDKACLQVENSKSVIHSVKKDSGLGLKNTRERLDILYRKNYELLIEETDTTYYSKLVISV